MNDELFMLWLSSLTPYISSRKLNTLLEVFGTARNAFAASGIELERAANLTTNAMREVSKRHNYQYIEELLALMQECFIAYFSREHERFPALLKEIPDPPVGIFCMGSLPSDNTHKVAIIGSRHCSEYGLMAARLLAKPLAEKGIVVVSGMARGVDSMAHRGAISGGGQTIAVLGCGADFCYPPENKELRDDIVKNGCVISEYPPKVGPSQHFFPARNRIISGLSSGIIVVEARKKSGTLITVDQAMEQGREVMAVPGNISSKLSEGTNQLIREGAHPVSDYTDILFALGLSVTATEPQQETSNESSNKNSNETFNKSHLAPEEKRVYDSLGLEPVSFDKLMEVTNLQPGQLRLICTELEIKELIRKLPGSRYVRA